MGMTDAYCGAPAEATAEEGAETFSTSDRPAGGGDPGSWPVTEPFNLRHATSCDRHVDRKRARRPDRPARRRSRGQLRGAGRAGQPGRERVARRRSPERTAGAARAVATAYEFVATWYGAQKIGAVTAEVYTFLQPKDYAYYLGYTEAGRGGRGRRHAAGVREAAAAPGSAAGARACPKPSCSRASVRSRRSWPRRRPRWTPRRPRPDDVGDLEVHHRQHRRAQGVRAPAAQPAVRASSGYAAGCSASRGRPGAAGAEAVLRLRARPGGAVPVRRRRAPGSCSRSAARRSGCSS